MTDTTIPQRAVRATDTPTNDAPLPLPPMPDTDPHAGGQPTERNVPEAALDAPTHDDMPAFDDHVAEPDPYAKIEVADRPQNFVREPFGEPRLKLQAPARRGYRRYWFNDEPGRIQRALGAGYSFVKVNGRNTRNVVGRAKNGSAQVAYLMEIPEDWFLQDVRRQQAKVDEIDDAIRGGTINEKGGTATKDGDNRYVPKDGIRYDPRASRDG